MLLGSNTNSRFSETSFAEIVRHMRAIRITRCLFLFVVAGLVTALAASDVSTGESSTVVVGKDYGSYEVTALSIDEAAQPGSYTFYASRGNAGSVDLKLNGSIVYTLRYNWQAKVGAGNVYTFEFPGYLQLSVTRAKRGTMNLYRMPESIFNGHETIVVPVENQATPTRTKPIQYSGGPGRVLTPKHNEQWSAGATVQIKWELKNYTGPVDIYLYRDIKGSSVEEKPDWIFHKNHAVKSQGTGAKRFYYRKKRDGDLEGFIAACKKRCESGKADGKNGSCGGFVVNFARGSKKKKPQHCVFKAAGASSYKKKAKDFYEWVAPIRIAENIDNDGHYRWPIREFTSAGTRQRISVVPTKGDLAGIESDEFVIKKWVKIERHRGQIRHYFVSDRAKVILPIAMSVLPESVPITLLWLDQSHWLHDKVTIEVHGSGSVLEDWEQENNGTFEWDLAKADEHTLKQCRLSPGCYFRVESTTRRGRVITSGFFRLGDPGVGKQYTAITAINPNVKEDDAAESGVTVSPVTNLTTSETPKPQADPPGIKLGDPVEIKWTDETTEAHRVRLVLSRNNQPHLTIASGIVSNPGEENSYTLKVLPYTVKPGEGWFIEVNAIDNSAQRGRSEPITITGISDKSLLITAPAAQAVWNLGGENRFQKISWTRPPKTRVRLDLYKAGHRIKTVTNKTKRISLKWSVVRTLATGNDYRLRLQALNPNDPEDGSVFTYSEPFCIQRAGETCEVVVDQEPVQPAIIMEGPTAEETLLTQWCTAQNIDTDNCQNLLDQKCLQYQLVDEACTPAEVERRQAESLAQPLLEEDETPTPPPVIEDTPVIGTTTCTWEEQPSSQTAPAEPGTMVLQLQGQEPKDREFKLYLTDVFAKGGHRFVEQLTPNKKWEPDSFNLYQTFEGDHRLHHPTIMPGSLTLLEVPVTPGKAATESVPHRDQLDGQLLSTRDGSKSGQIDHQDGSITRIPYPDRRVHWIARYASGPDAGQGHLQAAEKIGLSTDATPGVWSLVNSPIVPGSLELLAVFTSKEESLSADTPVPGDLLQISDDGNAALVGQEGKQVGTIDYATGEIAFDPLLIEGTTVFATYLRRIVDETLTADVTDVVVSRETSGVAPDNQTGESSTVVVGKDYGSYKVTALSIDGKAQPGSYTFYASRGNAGSVDLKLNGSIVYTLRYNWQAKVGAGNVYTFEFPGYLQLSVTRAKRGTMNLYGMPESIFDGRETIVVPVENPDVPTEGIGVLSFTGDNALRETPIVPGSARIKAGEVVFVDSPGTPGSLTATKDGEILQNNRGTIDYQTGNVTLDLSFGFPEPPELTARYYTRFPQGWGSIDYQSAEVTVSQLVGMPDKPVCSDFILTTMAQEEGLATLLIAFNSQSASPSAYEAAGIQGVTENNLDAVNTAIAAASPAPTTAEEIQAIVDAVNAAIQKALLTVRKYLRNVTDSSKNPTDGGFTYNNNRYFARGVKARQKDTLEYLVVITNGRDTDATGLILNDKIPSSTTYVMGSAAVDTDGNERFDVTAGAGGETEGPSDGIILVSENKITVYIGDGGTDAAGSETGGVITGIASAPNNKSAVLYQFTPKKRDHRPVKTPGSIAVGKAYGKRAHGYKVTALSVNRDAPPGTYTFLSSSGNAGLVELKRDGEVIDTLSYDWQAKVGAGKTYTFEFTDYLSLTVTKRGAGTMNLYAMPQSLFDDRQSVIVQ